MKRKSFLVLLLAFFSAGAFAQTTVDVFINGVKTGQYKIEAGQTGGGGISYKKSVYKKMEKLSIQISGKSVDGGYLKKLGVMSDGAASVIWVPETVGAPGKFEITDNSVFKSLINGKAVKLKIEKTPANTLSKEAVREVYIGTLSRAK